MDSGLTVQVHLDAAAHIVGARSYRYKVLGNIHTYAQTLGVDVREVMFGFLGIFMGDIQAYVINTVDLHLVVDGACHYIARSE